MASSEGPFTVQHPKWQQTFVLLRLNIQDGMLRVLAEVLVGGQIWPCCVPVGAFFQCFAAFYFHGEELLEQYVQC